MDSIYSTVSYQIHDLLVRKSLLERWSSYSMGKLYFIEKIKNQIGSTTVATIYTFAGMPLLLKILTLLK